MRCISCQPVEPGYASDSPPLFRKSDSPTVSCDESGPTKFPFSYLSHVTLLPGSGPAQDLLKLAHPKNYFRKATPPHETYFKSSRASLELVACKPCERIKERKVRGSE